MTEGFACVLSSLYKYKECLKDYGLRFIMRERLRHQISTSARIQTNFSDRRYFMLLQNFINVQLPMQKGINSVFGKAKRRKAAIDNEAKHLFANQTVKNTQPAKSQLFSILKEADISRSKRQKSDHLSKASTATKPRATANDQTPMQGHNFAHRPAGRPSTTPQPNRSHTPQYVTPTEQQTRRPDVREFKQANRLTGLFSSAAERSAQAEAAWKAAESTRRLNASRIQKEKIKEQAEREAKLAEERERIAKEQAEKQAALREQELSKRERQRVASIKAQNEQFRKAHADRKAGFVPDTMWPRENWQGVVFGDNYQAYKRSQQKEANEGLNWEERMTRAFNEGKPTSRPTLDKKKAKVDPFEGYKKHFQQQKNAKKSSKRGFDEANPDDYWGYGSGPSFKEEDRSSWEWAESPPTDYASGYGNPAGDYYDQENEEDYERNTDQESDDDDHIRNRYSSEEDEEYDDGDDYEGYGFFQGEEWENFKRSWNGHSRQHHHEYYYSNFSNFGYNGASGSGGGQGAGASGARQTANVVICQESAAREAQRAVEAARNNPPLPTTQEENTNNTNNAVEVRKQEIQTAVISAAQHSGNDIAAFASALKIHVDHSKGQEHAKKMAKKGLLMTFHPDKLARAGVLEQYLGQCVTQLILTSVK